MPNTDDLRRDRKAAATRMQTAADAITTLETAGTGADDEKHVAAVAEFDAAQKAFNQVDASVKRAEAAEAAAAASAGGDQVGGTQPQRPAAKKSAMAKYSSPSGAGPLAFGVPSVWHDQAKYPALGPSCMYI